MSSIQHPISTMNRDVRLIMLALLLWGFGDGLFFYIQPLYFEQLGADSVQIGGLFSAMAVVNALTFLPAGMLSDRLDRKWVMWGGWVLGVVGIAWVGAAHTWQGLVPGLLFYSFSYYCVPVISAYLAHAVEGRDLERTFTTVFAAYAAGSLFSPAIGGWLAGVTSMRTVYFAAAVAFALSTLVMLPLSSQPTPPRKERERRWRSLLNRRFLRFMALTWLVFVAMYLAFPLAPNFLAEIRGWDVGRIGALGSFQALGMTLLPVLLGRLSDGGRGRGLAAGQLLIWASALVVLLTGAFPALALAYLLRGAFSGCQSLTRARSTALGSEADRGLVLGTTDTVVAAAQIVAPYVAGWLYVGDPAYPFVASLVLIPIAILLGAFRRAETFGSR